MSVSVRKQMSVAGWTLGAVLSLLGSGPWLREERGEKGQGLSNGAG